MHAQQRPKRSADHHHRLLVENGPWLHRQAFALKEHSVRKFPLDQMQIQQTRIDAREGRARKVYEVQFNTSPRQVVAQFGDERLGVLMQVTRPVNEIYAKHAQRLLLEDALLIEKARVQDDVARLLLWLVLKPDAGPREAILGPRVTP